MSIERIRIQDVIRCLRGRVIRPEILDTLPPGDARASLADLTRLNRRWGGYSTLQRLLNGMVPASEPFSVLDVGAASGDMGDRIRERYPSARLTSLDRIPSHLERAKGRRVAGDAFALPFPHRSFDFVFCSLFLHHFSDEQIVLLFREFAAIARRAVLVIDLVRHPVAYYFVPFTRRILGWDQVTAHDAPASVEAAFRPRELEALATRAGLRNAQARAFYPAFRIGLTAEVARP